jgi:hypothetical protein
MVCLVSAAQEPASPAKPDATSQTTQTAPPSGNERQTQPPAQVDSPVQEVPTSKQQPKRIMGLMPNFRAVSAGAVPPPPTPKEAFIIATKNSFDYSSFVFVGITSGLADISEAHPSLGENGLPALGQYYWRGFLERPPATTW